MITTTGLSRKRGWRRSFFKRGFTLAEMMVATAVVGVVLAASTGSLTFVARGSAGLANYHDMNLRGRFMLDKFASDARMTVDVNEATSTMVSLDVYNSSGGLDTVVYSFEEGASSLSRTVYEDQDMSSGVADVILENVIELDFTYFNMIYDASSKELTETTKLLEIKEIQLEAVMRLTALNTINTNQIISARYMMRNKRVST